MPRTKLTEAEKAARRASRRKLRKSGEARKVSGYSKLLGSIIKQNKGIDFSEAHRLAKSRYGYVKGKREKSKKVNEDGTYRKVSGYSKLIGRITKTEGVGLKEAHKLAKSKYGYVKAAAKPRKSRSSRSSLGGTRKARTLGLF